MNRYFSFGFSERFPKGGMNDFIGDFETIEDAHTAYLNSDKRFEHVQIYDTEEKKLVFTSEKSEGTSTSDLDRGG